MLPISSVWETKRILTIRTKSNTLYVFATNSVTTRGEVGYRTYLDLDSSKQDIVADFIALVYGAENCYIYSINSMEILLAELAEDGEEYSEPVLLMKAPYNFGM